MATSPEDRRRQGRERQARFAAQLAERGAARVTIAIPAALLAELDKAAAALQIGRGQAIEDAIARWVRPVVPEVAPAGQSAAPGDAAPPAGDAGPSSGDPPGADRAPS